MGSANGHQLLTADDRDRLTELLDGGVETKDRRAYSLGVLNALRSDEAAGDESAERIVTAMAYDGVYRELGKQAKRETGVFKDSASGRMLNVPRVGSIAVLTTDGTSTGNRQLKLWEEMTRAEFSAWVDQQTHLAESLRFKVRGLLRILTAWERFPHATMARDVCELAGIDPESLELDVAA